MNLKIELEEMQNVREQRIAVPSLPHCPAPGVPRDLREPGAVCPPPFGACGVCARSGGTSESLGSDLPHGGLKSLGLFQSGMVPPVTQRARARTHTHTHTHTLQQPAILSREETALKSQEGRAYMVYKSMFNVPWVY